MSLQEFTWQQFLVAATVLSALWVLGVWLVYWRPLSGGGLSGGGSQDRFAEDALPHSWQDEVDELDGHGGANALNARNALNVLDDGLMDKPALEHGVSVLEADEFSFAPVEETKEIWEPNFSRDLEEAEMRIGIICRRMEREGGSKEDFFALFKGVKEDFPRLAGSGLRVELNDYIREQVPFYLSDQELDSLWV